MYIIGKQHYLHVVKICKKHKSMYIISKQHYLDVVQNLQKAEMDVYHRRTTLFSRSAAETDVAPI